MQETVLTLVNCLDFFKSSNGMLIFGKMFELGYARETGVGVNYENDLSVVREESQENSERLFRAFQKS